MLLDDLRDALREQGYSARATRRTTTWIKRYIAFHQRRHPQGMRGPELQRFLLRLSPLGQLSALKAIVFLYTQVLDVDVKELGWPAVILDRDLGPSLWRRLKAACHEAAHPALPATVVLTGRPVT